MAILMLIIAALIIGMYVYNIITKPCGHGYTHVDCSGSNNWYVYNIITKLCGHGYTHVDCSGSNN